MYMFTSGILWQCMSVQAVYKGEVTADFSGIMFISVWNYKIILQLHHKNLTICIFVFEPSVQKCGNWSVGQ